MQYRNLIQNNIEHLFLNLKTNTVVILIVYDSFFITWSINRDLRNKQSYVTEVTDLERQQSLKKVCECRILHFPTWCRISWKKSVLFKQYRLFCAVKTTPRAVVC